MECSTYIRYQNRLSLRNKAGRLLWKVCYYFFFRPFTFPFLNSWRLFILRLFGAKIGYGSKIHASAKIWAPWNLEIGQRTAIGSGAYCYNPGKIVVGNKVTISQYAYLCTASHDYTKKEHPLIIRQIIVDDYAWVAVGAFIAMGVKVGEGAIIGARSCVFKDVEPWSIVGGNPAKLIKMRVLED